MKKLFILVAAIFAYVGSVSASTNSYDFMFRLNEKQTFNAIMRYIQADYYQQDQLREMFNDSASRMNKAKKTNDEAAIEKALYFNLANARDILSHEQYRKYLALINVTVNNQSTINNEIILAEK